jgi:hypothetical protein
MWQRKGLSSKSGRTSKFVCGEGHERWDKGAETGDSQSQDEGAKPHASERCMAETLLPLLVL